MAKTARRSRPTIGFVQQEKSFIFSLGQEAASMLGFLENYGIMKDEEEETIWEGRVMWFRCSVETVKKGTGWSLKQQKRIFKFLEAERILLREMKGNPARRHIGLDYDQLNLYAQIGIDRYYGNKSPEKPKQNKPMTPD